MKFLLDQAVSWRIVTHLKTAGHDAVHVRDVGLRDADDVIILERARKEMRIVITQDTDFGTLLSASHEQDPSVILLRTRNARPEAHARVILANLYLIEEELSRGAIVVISDDVVRVRRLPIN